MNYVVNTDFKTINRRFKVGDVVTADDVDDCDRWVAGTFLSAEPDRPKAAPSWVSVDLIH